MPVTSTKSKLLNKKTGRYVSRTGSIGKKILKDRREKAKKRRNTKSRKDHKTKRTKNTKDTRKKRKYGNRGSVKTRSFFKLTSKGSLRMSARAYYNSGGYIGDIHCYDSKCKRLKKRNNGSPFWGAL